MLKLERRLFGFDRQRENGPDVSVSGGPLHSKKRFLQLLKCH
jgi:hypothetical protein